MLMKNELNFVKHLFDDLAETHEEYRATLKQITALWSNFWSQVEVKHFADYNGHSLLMNTEFMKFRHYIERLPKPID